MKKIKASHKAITMENDKAVVMEQNETYFFSDINGKPCSVKAKSREEAEKKAIQINK
jgi:hypothetical protein